MSDHKNLYLVCENKCLVKYSPPIIYSANINATNLTVTSHNIDYTEATLAFANGRVVYCDITCGASIFRAEMDRSKFTDDYIYFNAVVHGGELHTNELWRVSLYVDPDNTAQYSEAKYIDNANNVDYIIAQGSTGPVSDGTGWSWRKWNSGRAECWKYHVAYEVNAAKNNYQGFYYSDPVTIALPFTFSELDVAMFDGGSANSLNFVRNAGSDNTTAKFWVLGHESTATSVTVRVSVYISGKVAT